MTPPKKGRKFIETIDLSYFFKYQPRVHKKILNIIKY